MKITKIIIKGITCEACERLIKKRIGSIKGVRDTVINNKEGFTNIIADNLVELETIKKVLSETKYSVFNYRTV